MADDLSPSHPHTSILDSDADISSFLHTLLNTSSQPSASTNQPPSQFSGSAGFSDSHALIHPNFPISYSSADFPSEEEGRVKSGPGRSSSKRSRAAEAHNMSEKRRRQRINEKMKALQKLIPNSNKTDKASMLDEAIEYLKQLQLQVQMLTMRNCSSSSHPYYIPGAMQSASSLTLNEGNICRIGSFTADQEAPVETLFNLSSQLPSDLMARMSQDNGNSGQAYIPEPSMARHNSSFNASMSTKVPSKDVALPPLQLDMSHCGQSSSSGISS